MDKELKQWLDDYTVDAADDALINSIVQRAASSKHVALPVVWYQRPIARAAMFAALAVMGFSGGMLSTQPVITQVAALEQQTLSDTANTDSTIYQMIINPQSLEEVML